MSKNREKCRKPRKTVKNIEKSPNILKNWKKPSKMSKIKQKTTQECRKPRETVKNVENLEKQ